jgi:hypothetical protein
VSVAEERTHIADIGSHLQATPIVPLLAKMEKGMKRLARAKAKITWTI